MSGEDIQVVKRTIDAFNSGDLELAASTLDADSVWDWSRSIGPDKSVRRGPEEIVGFWNEFASGFEELQIEVEEVVKVGEDRLVAAILSRMRGRDGIEVEARNAWLITIRGEKLARLEMFQSKGEALEAVDGERL